MDFEDEELGCQVSVIIPVYNAENTIIRCVESVLYGRFQDLEILLIDDASEDSSWELCQKLAEQHANIRLFQNQKNRGVSYSRNKGMREAQGQYLLFVDSDDWVSGEYVSDLIEYGKEYQDMLVICGIYFQNRVDGTEQEFIWEKGGEDHYCINKTDFFELVKRFYLQQPFNKLFHKNIIKKYELMFPEDQTMGEDFQFVLDYIKAANIQKCLVLNKARYYYIRSSEHSLMSNFGVIENQNSLIRLRQLFEFIDSDEPKILDEYNNAVISTKNNACYQIVRNRRLNRREQRALISELLVGKNVDTTYRLFKIGFLKERTYHILNAVWNIPRKIIKRVNGLIIRFRIQRSKKQLLIEPCSIISQNCIGGVFSHDMGWKFLSPTVNLYFTADDFVKFVLNLKHYLNQELKFNWGETYPIGIIEDIKIHFMHYDSCTEAKEAWIRRKERIDLDRLIVFSTDRNGFNDITYQKWEKIQYPKVLFSAEKYDDNGCIAFPEYAEHGEVPDMIPDRAFYGNGRLISFINSKFAS